MVFASNKGHMPISIFLILVTYIIIFRVIFKIEFIKCVGPELSTGRMDPRVGSGRVGSDRSGHDFAGFWRVGSGRVGSALRVFEFFY